PSRTGVTIAAAPPANAPVVVLDEPTLGQDRHARDRLARLVTSLAEDGRLVLVVTHDMDFVPQACHTTVTLTRGALAYVGPTDRAFDDEDRVRRAGLELPHATRLARALGARPAPLGDRAFLDWWRLPGTK